MHLAPLIRDLGVILAVAGMVTFLFQRIHQPVVLGYIIAGVLIGPHTPPFPLVRDLPSIRIWAELGVIFLMFSLGLEFSFRKLARVGVSAGITAIFEVLFMIIAGYCCGRIFGWSFIDSVFLGAMLSISSTTIIIKALDELGLKSRHFSQIIFGVLIVEDLVAILILVLLSSLALSRVVSISIVAISLGKLLLIVGGWFLAGYLIVPRIIKQVGKTGSDELLLTLSLGFCLLLAVLAANLHYSVALGAFIMGSILAESTESHRIEKLVKPLRDIFAAIFFVSVGMLLDPRAMLNHAWPILIITVVTVVGKLTSSTIGTLITGQTLKTSIQVGFGLAQIGEFSFIIATLGTNLNVTSEFLYPIAVGVSLLTAFITPYLIQSSQQVANMLERKLPTRLLEFHSRYVIWSEERRASAAYESDFYRRLLRWFLNGLVVTIIWVLVGEFAQPTLGKYMKYGIVTHIVGWAIAILLSSPFEWAMVMSAYYIEHKDHLASGVRTFSVLMLTLVWLGLLNLAFFPVQYVTPVVGLLVVLLFTKFYENLERSYHWFEKQFLASFRAAEEGEKPPAEELDKLAPWNAHLIQLKVHPNSELAGKKILEAQLRRKFGLNIVVIQRGSKSIISPQPEEVIFPEDELLVLGTDEQVESARSGIETPPAPVERHLRLSDFELKRLPIWRESPLRGRTIRESRIRESYGAMIVGIERNGRRLPNPDTDMVIEDEDILLIVGQSERVNLLRREFGQEI